MFSENRNYRPTSIFKWAMIGTGVFAVIIAGASGLSTPQQREDVGIVVYKSPACGCCSLWINQLEASGLEVEVVNVKSNEAIRAHLDVPNAARSCHTARVGEYWVEGHVPVDLVKQLIEDMPSDIRGLAVPGMAIGSPGMEGPNPVDYEVIAHDSDGIAHVFATRKGQAVAP